MSNVRPPPLADEVSGIPGIVDANAIIGNPSSCRALMRQRLMNCRGQWAEIPDSGSISLQILGFVLII